MKSQTAFARNTLAAFVIAILAAVAFCGVLAQPAYAASADTSLTVAGSSFEEEHPGYTSITKGSLTVMAPFESGCIMVDAYENGGNSATFYVAGETGEKVTVESSNQELVEVRDGFASFYLVEGYNPAQVSCPVYGIGKATITVSKGADSLSFPVIAYPCSDVEALTIAKAGYGSVRLSWTPIAGDVTGYDIKRSPLNEYGQCTREFETIKTVVGAETSSATVDAPWGTGYSYSVVPYIVQNGVHWPKSATSYFCDSNIYTLPYPAVKIKAVSKSGSKNLKVSWTAESGATKYEVLRSLSENYGYKKIATTKTCSYTDKKVKKGTVYYYRVRAIYSGYGKCTSPTVAKMITVKSKAAYKTVKVNANSANSWVWSLSGRSYYYVEGSKLYLVCYANNSLKVIGFNSKMNRVLTRTVKLPKHDDWGGFYHGPDGNNYVAIGYDNPKESKNKVVIKVIKYSSKWKKGKTACIKGGASNEFEGICSPFSFGTVSFDMKDSTLYLFTSRLMFQQEDGLRHQSNIAFDINTKTMKAAEGNVSYVSHSFNQRVKFKDGAIYLADLGDAYDRGICLTWMNGYGSENTQAAGGGYTVPFAFKGEIGDNYVGASMGGLEIGKKNILVCGTAQPHNYKVAGVKGFGSYKQNVYVTVTNRTTGKSKVKWLTNINPKTGTQSASSARMVKLGDDRFAVMYSITSNKTGKSTLYYTVINNAGKKLLTKKYSGLTFDGGDQPILKNGCIWWVARPNNDRAPVLYKIPAL